MSYRWVEHTAEVKLEIEASTREAILADALRALGELIDDGPLRDRVACEIVVAGREPATLLVQWLDELLYRAETEDLVPEEVEDIDVDQHGLRAVVRCHRGTPRHLITASPTTGWRSSPPVAASGQRWC